MSNKDSRSGGKFTGNHTTLTPLACLVADIANDCQSVTKITPGLLKAGLKSVSGQRRVKITIDGARIVLSVRDNASHQEVHIFFSNKQLALEDIARGIRNQKIAISFG